MTQPMLPVEEHFYRKNDSSESAWDKACRRRRLVADAVMLFVGFIFTLILLFLPLLLRLF